MSDSRLLDPSFLFRFEISIRKQPLRWTKAGIKLPEETVLPHFGALRDEARFSELRLGWSPSGLGFRLKATGKSQLPWCRDNRALESDGVRICIDTRDSGMIHRGNRYCHHFHFAPFGAGPKRDQPFAVHLPVDRARESPPFAQGDDFKLFSRLATNGYELNGIIPSAVLHGYDPAESPRVRLFYAVYDRELGAQTLSVGSQFQILADPSLWVAAQLVE